MITSLKKLWDLFNKKERLQIFGLLIAILAMAMAQIAGVASVMPFMDLVMEPEMVNQSELLNTLYNYFEFESVNSFTIFVGFGMFFVIVISNLISTFAIWLKMKFVWKNNHHLSMKLLKQYMAKPYSYFLIHNSSDREKCFTGNTELNNFIFNSINRFNYLYYCSDCNYYFIIYY
jgi:ATP-binding cassette subfamily C protein